MLKLFKAGVSRQFARHEMRMIRAVLAAGLPVPEVFGEVTLDGRFGIVLQRLDGPTLWQLSRTGAVTFEQAGAIVAALAMSVHKTPPPPEVPSLREYMQDALRRDESAARTAARNTQATSKSCWRRCRATAASSP